MLSIVKRETRFEISTVNEDDGISMKSLMSLGDFAKKNNFYFVYKDGHFEMYQFRILGDDKIESLKSTIVNICADVDVVVEVVLYRDSGYGYEYDECDEDYEDRFNSENREVFENPEHFDIEQIRRSYFGRYVGLIKPEFENDEIAGGYVKAIACDKEYMEQLQKDGIVDFWGVVKIPSKEKRILCYDANVYGFDKLLSQEKIDEILRADEEERRKGK